MCHVPHKEGGTKLWSAVRYNVQGTIHDEPEKKEMTATRQQSQNKIK